MDTYSQTQAGLEEVNRLINLTEGEEVKLITRTHIVFFILKTIMGGIAIMALIATGVVIAAATANPFLVHGYWALAFFIIGFIFIVYTIQFHNYYLSKQIVTTKRIIDYDQRGLFRSESNQTFLENIENINVVQTSFWQTVFQFGNVDVQTAGQKTEISTSGLVFENVPNPKSVAAVLSRLTEQAKETHVRRL